MPQKNPSFTEKLQKMLRTFKREVKVLTAGGGPQLYFDINNAELKGPSEDVRKLRGLDLQIGAMMKPFNGAARVPDTVTAEIDRHVKDVADSFARVAAVKVEFEAALDPERMEITTARQETPVRSLEYVSRYKSGAGNDIEQRLLKKNLG